LTAFLLLEYSFNRDRLINPNAVTKFFNALTIWERYTEVK